MNKLNGGYVMLKYDASQEKLKDAYDSGKPVIVYDASNRGLWAKITESSGTYSIEPLIASSDIPEVPKLYKHEIKFTYNPLSVTLSTIYYDDHKDPYTQTEFIRKYGGPDVIYTTSCMYLSNPVRIIFGLQSQGSNPNNVYILILNSDFTVTCDFTNHYEDTVTEVL